MQNHYELSGNTVRILAKRKDGSTIPVLISRNDLKQAKIFPNSWCVMWCRDKNNFYCYGKMQTPQGRKSILLHRWVSPSAGFNFVDHINGNTLDNRSENLRIVKPFENSQNRTGAQRNSKTGLRGVSWNSRKRKWQAQIKVKNIRKHLGYFDCATEAEEAVKTARRLEMPFSKEALTCNICQ